MENLKKFISSLIQGSQHQISDNYLICIMKSPNIYDSIIPCTMVHPGRPCLQFSLPNIFNPFGNWRPFAIAHLLPYLLFKRKEIKENPLRILYRLFISSLRTSGYLLFHGIMLC